MNACQACGANLALVGRVHRCVTVTIDKPAKDSVTTKRNVTKSGSYQMAHAGPPRSRAKDAPLIMAPAGESKRVGDSRKDGIARKRGRKRQYVTNAERQRAYRERKRQSK